MYKRLVKHLDKTRKSLWDVCEELNIDADSINIEELERHITQCTHCDIWTKAPVKDLDNNPICRVCLGVAGL